MTTAKIAVIGDLHGSWDDWDVDYFDASDYELLLFTGDLGSGTGEAGVKIARSIARLAKPALVIPGNNDVQFQPEIAAEFLHQKGLIELLSAGERGRSRALGLSTGKVEMCGFSSHHFALSGVEFTLLAGRPNSMGGERLHFEDHLERNHGVTSLAQSRDRLIELIDQAPTRELLVLSHNGPQGLGAEPTDIFGCDFIEGGGDWGDPDLAEAIEHARAIGKRVLAVVAGHMHLTTRHGSQRTSRVEHSGTLYLNPARVPRIYSGPEGPIRSHVCLELAERGLRAREVLVPSER